MIDAITLSNILSHTAQVAILVAIAGAAHLALRLRAASVSYAYWRAVLAVCLLLPWMQGREEPAGMDVPSLATTTAAAVVRARSASVDPLPAPVDWTLLAVILLTAGCCARLAWLAVNVVRLRRFRSAGRVAQGNESFSDIQDLLGTRAEIRLVPDLPMPVTLGVFRPIVLLPADLPRHPDATQRAVVTHELLHVQRRDWVWHLCEEAALAVLWFNPAIWWLVARIRFTREAAVDEATVLVTGKRRAYIEALLAFTGHGSLTPAAPFARRRHLFRRIQAVSQEAFMSSSRIVITSALLATLVCGGGYYAVHAFPMSLAPQAQLHQAPGPLESRAHPVTPENPIPRRTSYEAAEYPAAARAAGTSGDIVLRITLDELGRVAELRRVGFVYRGPNATFNATAAGAALRRGDDSDLERIFSARMTPAEAAQAADVIEALTRASANALRQWRYEPPANGPISFDVTITFRSDGEVSAHQSTWTGNRGAPGAPLSAEGAVRVGGTIKPPLKLKDVRPVYPPEAQSARVSGMVILEVLIGRDGQVENARVLRSVPLLDQAAIDAAMQWRFTSTLLNGVPVPVLMTVTVNFTLEPGALRDAVAMDPSGVSSERSTRRVSPRLIRDVKPRYTTEAMQAGVEGDVEVEVTIGTDGRVTGARIIRGVPMLNESALEAVRQFEFAPLAEPATVTIELTFRLRPKR